MGLVLLLKKISPPFLTDIPTMVIAVNTRLLLRDKLEGLGYFTYETLKRITLDHKEHQFVFLFDRPYSEEFIFSENVRPLVLYPPARHPFLWYLFFEWAIPIALKKEKADLFLSTDGWLSLSTAVKSVNVIHDINFEYYPEHIKWLVRQYYHYYFPKFAQKATRIATVSAFSKGTLIEKYNIPDEKIDVVYNGVNDGYKPIIEEQKTSLKNKYTQGFPYFIFVGLLHPRKNIANLFKAYDLFRIKNDLYIKLVIVGEKKWWKGEMHEVYESMQYKDDVIFTGRLSAFDLQQVMAASIALVYVSVFEGFGVPIIEAMKCGVPVITGNVTAMPEVAGNAALFADPFSPASIAMEMQKIAGDKKLHALFSERGLERSKEFTWQKTADGLWNTIEKAIG